MDDILDRANARAEAKAQARFQAKTAAAASTRYEPIAAPQSDVGEVVKQAILHIGESADENAALMRNLVTMLMDSKPQPIKKWVVKVVPEMDKTHVRYGMAREYIFTTE